MNTTVIDHLSGAEDFSGLRVTTASRRVSPIRRFRDLIELSDWDEAILGHSKEIDAFCWLLAGGTAALLLPVSSNVLSPPRRRRLSRISTSIVSRWFTSAMRAIIESRPPACTQRGINAALNPVPLAVHGY